MSKYGDLEQKNIPQNKEHPDLEYNKDFFYKTMALVEWIPQPEWNEEARKEDPNLPFESATFLINNSGMENIYNPLTGKTDSVRKVYEYLGVSFFWKEKHNGFWISKGTIVPFHQANRKDTKSPGFREQLCACLNMLGGKGLLLHKVKTRERLKQKTHEDMKWKEWSI